MSHSVTPRPSGLPGSPTSRRSVLKGLAFTLGATAVPAGLLTACGSSSSPSGTSSGGSGGGATTVTFGSNYSDPAPKAAFEALTKTAGQQAGATITLNTVDHNTFQNNINSYLQGTPDTLFTWFAGYRMQFFAQQGLIAPIDDVWQKIGGNFGQAAQSLSKGLDGHYYFVPIYNYPWVVFYNKSTFQEKGYEIPKTWDDYVALLKKMKGDGLTPLAFADKDGWPALGTFDILNLRINGYDFHIQLMKHQVPWTDPRVTQVFQQWAEILPYCQPGATGRIWQDAVKTLESKQAGLMFQGTNQVAAQYVTDGKDLADLDFFAFPEINPQFGQDYMDAPTDGFCLAKNAKEDTVAAGKKVLEYLGTGDAEATFLKTDQWDVALAQGASIPTYNAIQKKSVEMIASCKAVSQFMDRDTDPGFASNVMIPSIQKFINDPSPSGIKSLQDSIEAQAKTIFTN
ncbi:ABC transporter substrate-binding protein [Microbispora corallina]|uniref:ABC transporter substrate-binding protein n=1 Tax=Microbispora corallina TaxID=83302 RepID=A0ABQ4G115_9ACTN|nr:extracellular solute-binding protein [Microbispora corallina]GIH40755.1 ABC transporter substrate-binding protein [Microbispora corallina]